MNKTEEVRNCVTKICRLTTGEAHSWAIQLLRILNLSSVETCTNCGGSGKIHRGSPAVEYEEGGPKTCRRCGGIGIVVDIRPTPSV
jgi:DnaJ-class molecular chaperone